MARLEAIKLLDGENPSLASKPGELELWGFVLYARLRLQTQDASARDLYRTLKLARWLGFEDVYNQARRLTGLMTLGTTLYRSDFEALYPRPFRAQVEDACKAYGVEDNLVWAVMRQESAFKITFKKVSFGGYAIPEVEEFLNQVADDIEAYALRLNERERRIEELEAYVKKQESMTFSIVLHVIPVFCALNTHFG